MTDGAVGARDLRVADVPHEHVPEAVLVLAFHRAGAGGTDELLAGQLVQRQLHFMLVATTHFRERARPEHLAQHGSVLKQALAVRRQGVEASGDQRLHRFRHLHSLTGPVAVCEQTRELLRIQGVAACLLKQRPLRLGRQDRALQQRRDQLSGLGIAQGSEVDPLRVAGAGAEGGMALVELRPRRTEEQQRHALGPVGEMLEKGEQGGVRPVQILEHQHRRPLGREALAEAPPGRKRLLLASRLRRRAHQRRQAGQEPGPVGIAFRNCPLELRRRLRGRVRFEDAALGFHDLPQRPEGDPVPVGQAPSLPPANQPRPLLHVSEQLSAEAALANPRLAHDCHQLARSLLGGTLERPDQQCPLQLAADQRRRARPDHLQPKSRPRPQRSPQRERLRLALHRDGLQSLPLENPLGRPKRLRRHRHSAHGGRPLQPRRRVHHIAGDDPLALLRPCAQRDDCLARVDPDPHLQRPRQVVGVQFLDRLQNPQPGAHRTLRVVLVRHRRTEHRHYRIADELLDRPPEALDRLTQTSVVGPDASADVLGVGSVGSGGETDEVAEENGDDLAFLERRRRGHGERSATLQAELRPLWILLAASPTARHTMSLGRHLRRTRPSVGPPARQTRNRARAT